MGLRSAGILALWHEAVEGIALPTQPPPPAKQGASPFQRYHPGESDYSRAKWNNYTTRFDPGPADSYEVESPVINPLLGHHAFRMS